MCLDKCFPNWCFQQKEKGPATLSYRSVHYLFMHIPKKLKSGIFFFFAQFDIRID